MLLCTTLGYAHALEAHCEAHCVCLAFFRLLCPWTPLPLPTGFPKPWENIGVRVHQQALGAHNNSSASACELLRAGSLVCLNELRARVGCAWR